MARPIRASFISGCAGILIVTGAVGLYVALNRPVTNEASKSVETTQASITSAIKPTVRDIASYNVAPDVPKYISIPRLSIQQTRIVSLGLSAAGVIRVPANIHDVGWYNGSNKPGISGATFLYGHVSNWDADGVFAKLHTLRPGDIISITTGNDTVFEYAVASSKTYAHDAVDMDEVLSPTDGASASLSLMTCAGPLLPGSDEFSQRLVVFARLVQ